MADYEKLLRNLTVLIVEDHKEARLQLERLIKNRVKKTVLACDGGKGLAFYKKYSPDLIITGIKMSNMNGLEMSKKIKKINPKVQIILLTAFDFKNFFLEAINIGINQYVLKPIGEEKLNEGIMRCMDLIVAQKRIEYQNKYIENMLDSQKNLVFVTDGKRIFVANKAFMIFCPYPSLEKLVDNIAQFGEQITFYDAPAANPKEWLSYLVSFYGEQLEISIVDNEGFEQAFLVDVNSFPELDNRYLVSLTKILINQTLDTQEEIEPKKEETAANVLHNSPAFVPRSTFYNIVSLIDKKETPIFMSYIYIENFSSLNLQFGYKKGDATLNNVGDIISAELITHCYATKLAGAEYLILSKTLHVNQIKALINTIKRNISKEIAQELPHVKVETLVIQFNTKLNVKKNFQLLYEQIKTFRHKK
jgi:two-component system, cell cycle response regulator